mgnify:CR=1 FL=1
METRVRVGYSAFSLLQEYDWLAQSDENGAVVTFTGKVRQHNLGTPVLAMMLEHYPGMAEKVINELMTEVRQRWELQRLVLIHRVGVLHPGDDIVLVGVSSAHRGEALAAAGYLMDNLKTRAPFWKRETTPAGERWIAARVSDNEAARRWHVKVSD